MNKPFILTCDASKSAIGYILSQIGDDNKEHVISYNGRSLRPSEKNYGITELECLSVIDACFSPQWYVSYCYLMPTRQFVSYVMARTSYIR